MTPLHGVLTYFLFFFFLIETLNDPFYVRNRKTNWSAIFDKMNRIMG